VTAGEARQYRWIHSNHSYKSGGALDAHFSLGEAVKVDVVVTLLDGRTNSYPGLAADRTHVLEVE